MSVLIIGNKYDGHCAAVQWGLQECGVAHLIWDWSDYPENQGISISISCDPKAEPSRLAWREHDSFESVSTVWFRRRGNPGKHSQAHAADIKFIKRESQHFLLNSVTTTSLARARWVNPQQKAATANLKVHQLQVAKRLGLRIPPTLISNNAADVRSFCKAYNSDIIYKAFTPADWPHEGAGYITPTTAIKPELLEDNRPVEMCPGIYQPRVKKVFELRVTVMGSTIYAAKLDSQRDGETTDWRSDVTLRNLMVQPYRLRDDEEQKVLSFCKELGVQFGCLDFVMEPDGELTFLEINEAGQFLFIEMACPDIKLLAGFSRFLSEHEPDSSKADFSTLSLERFEATDLAAACREWDVRTAKEETLARARSEQTSS